MKVNELRTKLKTHSKEETQSLLVEMYKLIPKRVRDAKEIDSLIENPKQFKDNRKDGIQQNTLVNFANVEHEVKQFIKNAYEQNYVAPNRIVSKKERSNWRFTAKKLVEQLTNLANHPDHTRTSINLLETLYELFCYASGHYVFASEEPFYTIKLSQSDFLERIISYKKLVDEPKKWIRESVLLILINDPDYTTLHSDLMNVLIGFLNNAPLKEETVSICEELLHEKLDSNPNKNLLKKSSFSYKSTSYINQLVEMIFICQSSLFEYEEAVKVYKHYHLESMEEVKLYILLKLIMSYQRVEDWMKEYEWATKTGVEPRGALQKMYGEISQTKTFPKYMY